MSGTVALVVGGATPTARTDAHAGGAIGRGLTASALAHAVVLVAVVVVARGQPRPVAPPVYRVALVSAPAATAGLSRSATSASAASASNGSAVPRAAAAPSATSPARARRPAVTAAPAGRAPANPVRTTPVPSAPHPTPEATRPTPPRAASVTHAAAHPVSAHAVPAHAAPAHAVSAHAVSAHPSAVAPAARSAASAKPVTTPATAPSRSTATASKAPAASAADPSHSAAKRPIPTSESAAPPGPEHAAAHAGGIGAPTAHGHDVADVRVVGLAFPYPGYLDNLVRQVRLRFEPTQARAGFHADLAFVVARDGSITGLRVVRSSGNYAFDLEAQGAVEAAGSARAFGPLPDGFHGATLPVTFSFDPRPTP